jgi:hypothetical protein
MAPTLHRPWHGGAAAVVRGRRSPGATGAEHGNLSLAENRALRALQARVRRTQKKAERLSNR